MSNPKLRLQVRYFCSLSNLLPLQHLNASTPPPLQWLFHFSEVSDKSLSEYVDCLQEMCVIYQTIASKCDKSTIYTQAFLENLTTLLRTAHDRAVAYRESATQAALQSGQSVPSLQIETTYTLKPLAEQIASLQGQTCVLCCALPALCVCMYVCI